MKDIKPSRFFEGVPDRVFEKVDYTKHKMPKPDNLMLKKITLWVKKRFKEPSTYKGVSLIAGVAGVSISPDLWEAIVATVAGVIGIIQVSENESKKSKE